MDCDSYQSIQNNISKPLPIRSILTDHTNTNLLDNTRKRRHNNITDKPVKTVSPNNKRSKQDTPPVSPVRNTYSSIFSLILNPFSIFYRWNPVKHNTHNQLTNNPQVTPVSKPVYKPQQPMQGAPDPLMGHNPTSTDGPTIKPWAYLSVKRDRDDLSSILSTSQRDSVSKNIFQTQTQSCKTIFKDDLFARRQNQSYLQLLASKSIPTDNLLSTPRSYRPTSNSSFVIDSIQLETTDIPSSTRLSSSLHEPPQHSKPIPVSSYKSHKSEPTSTFIPPTGRYTNQYRHPKYDKTLAMKHSQAISSLLPSVPAGAIRIPRAPPRSKPSPHNDTDDIHIVSVDKPVSTPCILATSTDSLSDIVMLQRQFELKRIKKEFEEEELNAYNRKMFLSDLERKQSAAHIHKPVKTRDKTSIEELNKKMDKLVNTLETDIEDSRMPGAPYKPVDLGDEMELRVTRALVNTPIEEELSSGFRLHIKRKDMSTLQTSHWLNDEIINFYCSMIADRSQQKKDKPLPTVYAFNTFFYTQLKDRGYDSIKRWTRRIDIFTLDMIIIPIHLGMHWCMAIINFRRKTVVYYDSFLGSNVRCLNLLFEYLHKERLDKKGETFDSTNWELTHEKEIPEQKNSSDCGVFACQFAEFMTREAVINFTQDDMSCLRRQMVAEILNKKLYH
ncbi:Sentrin-specific protease 1 [Oopsacas minuta]|uniref:Sentrin-specific protease 1 n=1 Tax=Oopsacas minuta TaxID=111878 RepID=A0AAV7K6A6_9METZ|nr:Sentrin-specific protease 1 [Oopsacas minuta]